MERMLAARRLPPDPATSSPHRYTSSYVNGISTVYAIPAQRRHENDDSREPKCLSYAEHELLRSRKTPHGRIDEHHEATCLDRNIHVPASKHVILSVPLQSPSGSRPHHNADYERDPRFLDNSNAAIMHPHARVVGRYPIQTMPDGSRPTRDFLGMDSSLHQTPIGYEQNYYYHPGSNVPTVLPASLHTFLGPTTSAGQQYYGPYWPDGTFSPYRPAPVRDMRFHEHEREHQPIFLQPQLVPNTEAHPLRHPGRLPSTRDIHSNIPNHVISPNGLTHGYMPFYDRMLSMTQKSSASLDDVFDTTGYRGQVSESTPPIAHSLPTLDPGRYYKPMTRGDASDRIAFRDRTFSWAHQVYVELLSTIQRENRLGRPANDTPGQSRRISKPSIFPKPPQRSGSCFKDLSPLRNRNNKDGSFRSNHWPHSNGVEDERPRTAIHDAHHKGSQHNTRTYPTLLQHSQLVQKHTQETEVTDPRRGSDPSTPRTLYQFPAPHSAAVSALETMELLCDEADAPWTDGMLLAGCLAYGLEKYSKSLTWYQRILSQNSSHVEAMSNLAATLLALGKRDEALQHWSAAVRLRPSYFEAVEHLIGLLCAAQRAREAVDMIRYVESCLKLSVVTDISMNNDLTSDGESDTHSRTSSIATAASNEQGVFEYDAERRLSMSSATSNQQAPGFGSSGYAIAGADNGRLLALIHAKGNMLYGLGENAAAAASFEDAILVATGHRQSGVRGLIRRILYACISRVEQHVPPMKEEESKEPILLSPERAQQTAQRMFPPTGELPGIEFVPKGLAHKAAISTTSNSLLSLAKIYQDGMVGPSGQVNRRANGTREILALYYLSLSLQRSPSTANNVGILLASVQQTTNIQVVPQCSNNRIINYAGIAPGSSIALALQYYNYGLNIDSKHAHLYTNLGSLLKDLGQLGSAIKMYEIAVQCDANFDIALANLANAVKDQGKIAEAITYYRRAVEANPDFAEAVCGLATALSSVCNWYGRGGVYADGGQRDRIHVDDHGNIQEARKGCGWMNRVVEIVDKQLKEGECWGSGTLTTGVIEEICQQLSVSKLHLPIEAQQRFHDRLESSLKSWSGRKWEGARIVRIVERAIKVITWQWYQDRHKARKEYPARRYARPLLPVSLSAPTAPTVLPFHTFTTPLSAKQVRQISQRNALRISVAAMRAPWLPMTVYPPPAPPSQCLNVGYVSSDFNNHPLAHLMQSIFGLHNRSRVQAFCYATTSSDGSIHRRQIEKEAPVFRDASTWSVEKLINQIVNDGIHVLVNLNGYTRGAKNEVFAARPAPIHMSFMGFAGTLGAEWCDYVFADPISVLPKTLSPWRRNVDIEDRLHPDALVEDQEDWIYSENVIFAQSTFFCVDHKQSAPDALSGPPEGDDESRDAAWRREQDRRWQLRKTLFPTLPDSAVILGNFNQLYKIDPSTFRMYLRILAAVPNAILWLLRFPDVGEANLKNFAYEWAGSEVASRVIFTDVAPKGAHITRASVVDLFLDTPECNAHTTAADVIWSGTPIVTWARWDYKMCSRMASSIVASALPDGPAGDEARRELLVYSEGQYEGQAIHLAAELQYLQGSSHTGRGRGRLMDLRRTLWEGRWTSRLFDTKRWVRELEDAYWIAWTKWEAGEGGDIWL